MEDKMAGLLGCSRIFEMSLRGTKAGAAECFRPYLLNKVANEWGAETDGGFGLATRWRVGYW
jgi:hypothetical protein